MKTVKLFSLLLLASLVGFSAPTDNPVASFYDDAEGYPDWTNEINWTHVIDMSKYKENSGLSNYEKFKLGRDSLAQYGGGVLYYPGGTYHFDVPDGPNDEGLMLKPGVVIRGEKPSSDDQAVTTRDVNNLDQHGLTSNPTKFVFSRRDMTDSLSNVQHGPAKVPKIWNMIGCKPVTASHVGVAWVEIEYGYIFFGVGSNQWGSSWESAGAWMSDKTFNGWGQRVPDGTHPMDPVAGLPSNSHAKLGEKRFVMGVHLKNACISNYAINKAQLPEFELEHGSYRFTARMSVYGKHVFLANNCISQPDTSIIFRYDMLAQKNKEEIDDTTRKIISMQQIFDPAKGGSIDVNKSHMSHFVNKCDVDDPNTFYAPDVIVKDNWLYNHSGKGIEFAGKWCTIQDNVNYRHYYGFSDVYGTGGDLNYLVHSSSGRGWDGENYEDYMSRFMDYGGWNNWIHNNRYTGQGSRGNDGEGVLCQRHTGVESYSFALTYNKQGSTGESGYISPYDVHCIGLFHGWNIQRGWVGFHKTAENYGADIAVTQNYDLDSNLTSPDGAGGTYVQDFLNLKCPSGTTPGKPSITLEEGFRYIDISWTDVENEAAYRVERKEAGTSEWVTIAYRPRQETGGLVTFDDGPRADGYIETLSDNYLTFDSALCWDGETRNMNPPKWRDYTTADSKFYYRVVAVGCDAKGTMSNTDSVGQGVGKHYVASEPVAYKSITIQPNPVNDEATVSYSLEKGERATVKILSLKGKLLDIPAENTEAQNIQINGDAYSPGTYIIQLRTNKQVVTHKKMIIR